LCEIDAAVAACAGLCRSVLYIDIREAKKKIAIEKRKGKHVRE
jgi:hypothetical protein